MTEYRRGVKKSTKADDAANLAALEDLPKLSPAEQRACRQHFKHFDRENRDCIDDWETRLAMEALNQNPSDDELGKIMGTLHLISCMR